MIRQLLIFIMLPALSSGLKAQYGQAAHTVMTIGNIADVEHITEFSKVLLSILDTLEQRHTILFTGDIDKKTINFARTSARLDTLVSMLADDENRKLIFIPGDRDWDHSGLLGWDRVNLLEDYIVGFQKPNVLWPLRDGCPGPEKINLGLTINLVAINTQWWNHPYDKPTPESATCRIATSEGAIEELRSLLDEARFGNLIIAGHYPIFSNGNFGGKYPWHQWLFPVPVVSSMVTAYRQNIGSPTEITNERFEEFHEEMEDILREYSSLTYLSGHERCTELLRYYDNALVNAGAPDGGTYVESTPTTLYKGIDPAIVVINYDLEGNAWGVVYAHENGRITQSTSVQIFQAPCESPIPDIPVNERLIPCLEDEYVLLEMTRDHPDDTTLAANPTYAARPFKRKMLGQHYRKSWTTPVTVPILNLDTTKGGLTPYQVGGGRQTKSLKMLSDDGAEYVFRSVDKDPSKALDFDLRETLISLAIQDQTTTQQPYGAVVVSRMLDTLDILHASPRVYVMPVDEKLGPFKEDFGGMLGMLEERPTGNKEIQYTFADADEIKRSVNMIRLLYEDGDNTIALNEFLQARVFDILVGDWGKHEDNWKWAGYEDGINMEFRPIPRDRDHVFSRWDGLLPWLADREWAKPSGENFDFEIKGLRSLMWQARHLDRLLANKAEREDWLRAAELVRERMTDEIIEAGVSQLPDASEEIDGEILIAKLKSRRDDLPRYADEYYSMLAKEVDIVGSVKRELFEVTRLDDGRVRVEMFKIKRDKKDKLFYSRTFLPEETKEIRLFGLLGEDEFKIGGDVKKSILVRVIPGQGRDIIIDSSAVRKGRKMTRLYDRHGTDRITMGKETRQVRIPNSNAYLYNRTSFTYNTYLPYGFILFTSANGLQVGGGTVFTNQSYDKPDFSSQHSLLARVTTLGNLHFGYEGRWRHVIGRWDFTAGISLDEQQRFNYFFGYGNDTQYDLELFRDDYYSLQFSNINTKIGLARQFWTNSIFEIGVQVATNGPERGENNIFDTVAPATPGNEGLRTGKLVAQLELDFRDRVHLPTRGMRLYTQTYFAQLLNDDGDYSLANATLEAFATAKPFTLGVKVGAAVHGGTPPFYDQFYLGQITHLRGYRENRFAGKRAYFFNSDLRIELVDNPSALLPHKMGITLFCDTGRVSIPEESSKKWHVGYGVGFYYVPFRERFAIQLSAAFSEEESGLLRLSFGQSF